MIGNRAHTTARQAKTRHASLVGDTARHASLVGDTARHVSLVGLFAVGSFAYLAACSSESAIAQPDIGSLDAAISEVGSSDVGSDAQVFPRDIPCEEPCRVRYRELEPFDVPVDHHTSFVLERTDGAYLYVVGGIESSANGQQITSVNRRVSAAKILPDGSLGPWEHQRFPFNVGLAFHSQAVTRSRSGDDLIFLGAGLGWSSGDSPSETSINKQTFVLQLPAVDSQSGLANVRDTSISTFDAMQLADFTLLHSGLAFTGTDDNRHLNYIGGTKTDNAAQTPTDEVWSLRYLGEEPIALSAALPETRSHHALVEAAGNLYVLGGFGDGAQPSPRASVLRADLNAQGQIRGWLQAGTIDDAPWTAASFEHNGYLYLVGGGHQMADEHHHGSFDASAGDGSVVDANIADASIDAGLPDASHTGHVYEGGEPGFDGNPFIARVRRARILEDGSLGSFEDANPLPIRRSHVHQTPIHRNFFYSVGGRTMVSGTRVKTVNRIFVGEIL